MPNRPALATDLSPAPPEDDFEEMLYARHVEIKSLDDLTNQRGTPIPALFNTFYKFIQNPSTVSVETFKRMIDTDDTIGSGVDFLTTCLAARLGTYTHESDEITEFVNKALDQIQGGWTNVIKELLSATWAGYAVSEKVWANTDLGFVPKKIVALPPGTILFETERTGELTQDGILQYQRNYNPFLLGRGPGWAAAGITAGMGFSNVTRPDVFAKLGDVPFPLRTANTFNYLCIRIPTQKAIHYAFDAQGKFGNPYGRSLLRRAYKYYVIKDAVLQMMAIALDRKGTPLTIVFSDPHTTLQTDGSTGGEVRGDGSKGISAQDAARKAFANIHNDSVLFLPGKRDDIFSIDKHDVTANAADFISALDFCNKSLLRALLVPSLIFGNGDGTGSFALGQEHAKTFDKLCDGILSGLVHVVRDQLVAELIQYNFPESAWKKDGFGEFGKRQLTADEIGKEVDIFEKAVNIGAVDMTDLQDLNALRDKINMPPRKTPIVDEKTLLAGQEEVEAGAEGVPPEGDSKKGDKGKDKKDEKPEGKKEKNLRARLMALLGVKASSGS